MIRYISTSIESYSQYLMPTAYVMLLNPLFSANIKINIAWKFLSVMAPTFDLHTSFRVLMNFTINLYQ